MATLDKIRSKGALLVIVIGLALLAFIVGDFLNSGATYFGRSRETIAEIGDEDIHYTEYGAALEQMIEVYKIETGQSDLNEDMMDQIHNSVWETMINEKLLYSEAAKIGLSVSSDELSDHLIGKNIHQLILQRSAFADQTGRFSHTNLMQFLNYLDQPAEGEMKTQVEQAKRYWKFWEKTVKTDILQEKYNTLISKSIVANNLEAKMSFDASKVTVDANYIVQPYFMIPDSVVTVSNTEIKERYNKNKDTFKQEDNRSISYVVFEVKPLENDFIETEEWINGLSEEFTTTDDIVSLVNSNSDVMYNGRNYTEFTIRPDLKNFAFNGKKDDVVGPLFENETYTMARIMETGTLRSDSVKLRHIFLLGDDASKEDSIVKVIRQGGNFAELAMNFSAVQQTAANGGEIGWIQDGIGGIDKEISEPAFAKGVNEVFTVKNTQGVQIIQVMEKTPVRKKVKVAILERKVTASSRTYSKIYNDAKQFGAACKDFAKFTQLAEDSGYIVRPAEVMKSTRKVGMIPQSRQVVRWAFDNAKDNVSDVFDCNNQFVVVALTNINEGGYRSLESVSTQLKAELIKEKKGDLTVKNISEQQKQTPDFMALAVALNVEVKEATNVTFDAYQFGGAGFEPAVIGRVSTLGVNEISSPIKGNAGVYVAQATNNIEGTATFDEKAEIQKIESRISYSIPYQLQQHVRSNTKITDNRLNFY